MHKQEFIRRFQHISPIPSPLDFPLKMPGKPAAVLLPLVHREELTVLFTQRASHLKHHPGQISFPGGRWESTDRSLVHTALRETEEEVGIPGHLVEVIGSLPTFRTISRYEVKPIIGFIDPGYDANIDHNEVNHAFEVPLSFLMQPENYLVHWVLRKSTPQPVYFIPWQDKLIWGATASFLNTLRKHVNKV